MNHALYNYSGPPGNTTNLFNPPGQMAFGINSAGNIVDGNGTTAFYLPNGGSPETLNVPAGAINAFGINDDTGKYTFLDDPAEAFSHGVEVTQITGINNSGVSPGSIRMPMESRTASWQRRRFPSPRLWSSPAVIA